MGSAGRKLLGAVHRLAPLVKRTSLVEHWVGIRQICGALAMGLPGLRFKRRPEHSPANLTWLEAA